MYSRNWLCIDQTDFSSNSIGGIRSFLDSIIKFSETNRFSAVGLSSNKTLKIGDWVTIEIEGVRVKFLPVGRTKGTKVNFLPNSLILILGLIRFRKEVKVAAKDNLVNVHRLEIAFALIVLFFVRPILFLHNSRLQLTMSSSSSRWKYFPILIKFLEFFVLRNVKVLILLSRKEYERLKNISVPNFHIQTWYDSKIFHYRRNILNDNIRLLWVGRLEDEKNPLFLLDIAEELQRRGIRFHLTVIGDGSLSSKLKKLTESKILSSSFTLTGSLPKRDVANHLANADTLIMTSHYEGSSITLKEALACGVPVILNRDSDPDENIKFGVNGFVIEKNNVNAYVQSILKVRSITPQDCSNSVNNFRGSIQVPSMISQVSKLIEATIR